MQYRVHPEQRGKLPTKNLVAPLAGIFLAGVTLSCSALAQSRHSAPSSHPDASIFDQLQMQLNSDKTERPAKAANANGCFLPPLTVIQIPTVGVASMQVASKARKDYSAACGELKHRRYDKAERRLRQAVNEQPKYAAAWVTLGQLLAARKDVDSGRRACSQAQSADPSYVPSYLCLADIATNSQNWDEVLDLSSRVLQIDIGKNPLAYYYNAAAKLMLRRPQDAEKSARRGLELDDEHRIPKLHYLLGLALGQTNDYGGAAEQIRTYIRLYPKAGDSVQKQAEEFEQLYTDQPKGQNVDPSVTRVSSDGQCPLAEILGGAGLRATELVDNLQRFTATEQIENIEFRRNGTARTPTRELYEYVAELAENPRRGFWIEEYRRSRTQNEYPSLLDTGTAGFALMFHPKIVGNFEIHCAGQTYIQGIPAWQLNFMEGEDPNKSFNAIRIKDSQYQLRFKGQAWIGVENYNILRLETDLVAPLPEIHLQVEHFDVAYAPVSFAGQNLRLWLPENASMHISYRGHHYQRVHRFSHFQLFLVGTEQNVKEPSSQTDGGSGPHKSAVAVKN
jgi:TolA-binding protein